LTRGEILLLAFIFALVYGAGLLPRLAAWLSGAGRPADGVSKSGVEGASTDD
jgi:hypothetical protein